MTICMFVVKVNRLRKSMLVYSDVIVGLLKKGNPLILILYLLHWVQGSRSLARLLDVVDDFLYGERVQRSTKTTFYNLPLVSALSGSYAYLTSH